MASKSEREKKERKLNFNEDIKCTRQSVVHLLWMHIHSFKRRQNVALQKYQEIYKKK